ncbi:primary-amine oxidase [Luethyella okanaganae]|uniref:Amine oxidase n=1 Tax=Luethyella okanaganae TaxID=69372 RepID=A0ABW1VDS6_9MICO
MTNHPLDPLSLEEVAHASRLVRDLPEYNASWRTVFVLLQEIDKEVLRAWQAGGARPPREALVVIRDKGRKLNVDIVVDLVANEVVRQREYTGAQPAIMREESLQAERLARSNPEWQQALRRRGVEDFGLAMLDHMPLSYQDSDDGPQSRRGIALTWMRSPYAEDNGYARPVEGLIVHFDLDAMTILRVEDHGGAPIPMNSGNYTAESLNHPDNVAFTPDGPRPELAPLDITQPAGAGFTLDGWKLEWGKWDLRIGFNAREGLVLYEVGYSDEGRRRPIAHRLSVSEMFVPYADPSVTHFRKQLFDQGESGLGRTLNSLRLGCDCLGEVLYLDGCYNDNDGEPVLLENAICIHEEDFGVLWRHTNLRTRAPESRRSRRLVVSTFATVGNYDYGFFWYFYLDGTIEFETKLTGILSTGAVAVGQAPEYGTLLNEGLYAPNHQHWFNVRLDMSIDGDANQLQEINTVSVEDDDVNFFGGAWKAEVTSLDSELRAQRNLNAQSSRYWRVVNPNKVTPLGGVPGYALIPGENAVHYYRPDAPALARAAFIQHHLWATRYRVGELYAAGDHPNQHPGGAGLPEWTAGDASLENTDTVVWYTFGVHHIPRPEDWPVMPVHHAGFKLKPSGFFRSNPAVDLPVEDVTEAGHDHCSVSAPHNPHSPT